MAPLLARGAVRFSGGELNDSQRAQAVVDAAHRCVAFVHWQGIIGA
jgi:hypothetical protein